jgi:hypothetical protein
MEVDLSAFSKQNKIIEYTPRITTKHTSSTIAEEDQPIDRKHGHRGMNEKPKNLAQS